MVNVRIKPLSVNKCWAGRRFKTQNYKDYIEVLLHLLPDNYKVPDGDLKLIATCGYSSKASDIDNFLKPFIDVLQLKYNFNDSRIYCLIINKVIVKKGEEFINFKLNNYEINS